MPNKTRSKSPSLFKLIKYVIAVTAGNAPQKIIIPLQYMQINKKQENGKHRHVIKPVKDIVSMCPHFYRNLHPKMYTNSRFHLYPYIPYPSQYPGADTYIQ